MRYVKQMRPAMMLGLLLTATMQTGCRTTTGGAAIDTLAYCDAARPFRWSRKDTLETITQAKEINAIGVQACGWGKKK